MCWAVLEMFAVEHVPLPWFEVVASFDRFELVAVGVAFLTILDY